jgi:hypothetical protein
MRPPEVSFDGACVRDSAFALGRVGRTTIDGGGGQTEILELTLDA